MRILFRLAYMVALFLVFSFNAANAQLPPDIQASYEQYETALAAGDLANSAYHAYTAWQTAEDSLGKDSITGDMAFAFGAIDVPGWKEQREENHIALKLRLKALERSVKLANYESPGDKSIELNRRLKLGDTERFFWKYRKLNYSGRCPPSCGNQEDIFFRSGFNPKKFRKVDDLIKELGLENTETDFRRHLILAKNSQKRHKLKNRLEKMLKHSNASINILPKLENRPSYDDLIAIYSIQAFAQRNSYDFLSAAQSQQELYNLIKDCLTCEAKREFLVTKWTYNWVDLIDEGQTSEADLRGLRAPDFDRYPKASMIPVRSNGSFVNKNLKKNETIETIYDINESGSVENIRFPQGGNKQAIFTIETVLSSNVYSPTTSEKINALRKNISRSITVRKKSNATFIQFP